MSCDVNCSYLNTSSKQAIAKISRRREKPLLSYFISTSVVCPSIMLVPLFTSGMKLVVLYVYKMYAGCIWSLLYEN